MRTPSSRSRSSPRATSSSGSACSRASLIRVSTSGTRRTDRARTASTCSRSARASRARTSRCSTGSACRSSTMSPTTSCRASTGVRRCSSFPPGSRASGCPLSRRWRAAHPSSARATRRSTRRPATPPCASTWRIDGRSPRGSRKRASGATSSSRAVSSTRAVHVALDRRGAASRLPRGSRVRVVLDVSPLRLTRAGPRATSRGCGGSCRSTSSSVSSRGAARAARRRDPRCGLVSARAAVGRARRRRVALPDVPRSSAQLSVPMVVTVLDLAVLRHPELFNPWTRTYSRLTVPRVVRAARRVIAVSEFTKRELVELLGVTPARDRVVPNAARARLRAGRAGADGDYVLAVGTLEPRKNLARVAEAAARAGVELRVVGARGWGGVDAERERPLARRGRRRRARRALPRRARLVYPSLYEGFGIPVARGDGVRRAGRHVSRRRDRGGRRRRGGARRPARPASIAAGIETPTGDATSSSARSRAGAVVHLGRRRRGAPSTCTRTARESRSS